MSLGAEKEAHRINIAENINSRLLNEMEQVLRMKEKREYAWEPR